ncbi:MAG: ABC transporter substrate-binding protein [Clostridia bacterium]|nr:ABC transporter substrate-binding protein [Clostridia bacterium]
MKKKISALILTAALLLSLVCCGSGETEKTVNAAVLKGPTGMGAAWLMEKNEKGESLNSYNFTVAGAADEITAGLVSDGIDLAAVPTNLASVLYNKTNGGVCVLAVNTLGVLYVLEKGDSISSVKDLEGKKIVSAGQGTTAQYVFEYILEQNGVKAETEYVSEHTETASLALSGKADIVVVPEPFVTSITSKDASFRKALDLTEEWEKLGKGELVMGAIAARKEFVDENPDAVKAFMSEYEKSVAFTNENVEQAAALCGKFGIVDEAVAKKAIPNSHIVFMDGRKMADTMTEFLNVLYSYDPSSVGAAVPADGFYYGI